MRVFYGIVTIFVLVIGGSFYTTVFNRTNKGGGTAVGQLMDVPVIGTSLRSVQSGGGRLDTHTLLIPFLVKLFRAQQIVRTDKEWSLWRELLCLSVVAMSGDVESVIAYGIDTLITLWAYRRMSAQGPKRQEEVYTVSVVPWYLIVLHTMRGV